MQQTTEYKWLREYKGIHGWELLHRHGAHSIGIGHKRIGGRKTDRLALIFYVERNSPQLSDDIEPVPSSIKYIPKDASEPVVLKTDVVECEPAQFE